MTMAQVYLKSERSADALAAAEQSMDIMQKLYGRRFKNADFWETLAKAREAGGQTAAAREAKREALALRKAAAVEEQQRRRAGGGMRSGLPLASSRQQRRHPSFTAHSYI
jgi:predicted Zn-dependent protease